MLSTKNDISLQRGREEVTFARNPNLSHVAKILGARATKLVYILSMLANSYS